MPRSLLGASDAIGSRPLCVGPGPAPAHVSLGGRDRCLAGQGRRAEQRTCGPHTAPCALSLKRTASREPARPSSHETTSLHVEASLKSCLALASASSPLWASSGTSSRAPLPTCPQKFSLRWALHPPTPRSSSLLLGVLFSCLPCPTHPPLSIQLSGLSFSISTSPFSLHNFPKAGGPQARPDPPLFPTYPAPSCPSDLIRAHGFEFHLRADVPQVCHQHRPLP